MPERDPLDDLTAAWRAIEAPRLDAELDDHDPATEAAVDWLRKAWERSAPETVPETLDAPWRARRLQRRARPVRTFLAVAASITAVFALVRALGPRASDPPTTVDVAVHTPLHPSGDPPGEPRTSPQSMDLDSERTPELIASTSERLELRSGNVRLLLFTPSLPDLPPPDFPQSENPPQ